MTSGEKVHYNGMLDAGRQIVRSSFSFNQIYSAQIELTLPFFSPSIR